MHYIRTQLFIAKQVKESADISLEGIYDEQYACHNIGLSLNLTIKFRLAIFAIRVFDESSYLG